MKVIIVDDDPQIRLLLSRFMEAKGAEVRSFETGRDAQQNIEWCDGIVCDGIFPLEPETAPMQAWRAVAGAAIRYDKGFVLLSGEAAVCEAARRMKLAALLKGSTRMEEVWLALVIAVGQAENNS